MVVSVFHAPPRKEWSAKSKTCTESRPNKAWRFKHPHIPQSFYDKIAEPTCEAEAIEYIQTHQEALADFSLQLDLADQELLMLRDPMDGQVPEYQCEAYEQAQEKRHRLILGKRFHLNASNAYSYWTRSYQRVGLD